MWWCAGGREVLSCDFSFIAWFSGLGSARGSRSLALGWVVVALAASPLSLSLSVLLFLFSPLLRGQLLSATVSLALAFPAPEQLLQLGAPLVHSILVQRRTLVSWSSL